MEQENRIKIWVGGIGLVMLLVTLIAPGFLDEYMLDITDRPNPLSRLFGQHSGMDGYEPEFLAVESLLRTDALSRNSDTDFSEWYYPRADEKGSSLEGLARFDGSAVDIGSAYAALQDIWRYYDHFTSICVLPDRTIFSYKDGASNLVYSPDAKRPTYLLREDEPIEIDIIKLSGNWYRIRVTKVPEQ